METIIINQVIKMKIINPISSHNFIEKMSCLESFDLDIELSNSLYSDVIIKLSSISLEEIINANNEFKKITYL